MATFTYVHGDTLAVDHTEAGAVTGNTLVIAGGRLLAARTPKDAGVTDGYVFPNGTGVFDFAGFTFDTATGVAFGEKVYCENDDATVIDTDSSVFTTPLLVGTVISTGAAQTDNLRVVFGG